VLLPPRSEEVFDDDAVLAEMMNDPMTQRRALLLIRRMIMIDYVRLTMVNDN